MCFQVLEFDAPPDTVVMPLWMMNALGLGEEIYSSGSGCDVLVERVSLPKGSYAKFQVRRQRERKRGRQRETESVCVCVCACVCM